MTAAPTDGAVTPAGGLRRAIGCCTAEFRDPATDTDKAILGAGLLCILVCTLVPARPRAGLVRYWPPHQAYWFYNRFNVGSASPKDREGQRE